MSGDRVLVVDDEPGVRATLSAILLDEGYGVVAVESGEEGLEALEASPFDAVLLDVWLPGIDGLETLTRIRDLRVDAEVIMISGHGTVETAVRATKLGAFDFVEKPLSLDKTLVVLRNALRSRKLERRNLALVAQLARDTELLGSGPAYERLRAGVEAAASSGAAVLLLGESGSGRETAARRIHSLSVRAGEAFVPVPCAALDPEAGSELLFGDGERPGLVRLAERGTLFLEDADRLPGPLQERLAASLAATGGPDVRSIASVRPEPEGLVPELRHLVDVVRIHVAPLRERREDIPILAARFLQEFAREYGRPEKRLTPDATAALTAHRWPGNARELRNAMERVALLPGKESISASELAGLVGESLPPAEDLYGEFPSLEAGLAAFERHFLRRALQATGGDRDRAAGRVGLDRAALEARLRAQGLG